MDEEIEEFLKQHETCFDRFTFDKIFRFLLANDFSHEDAKDTILFNCSLSALVLQERIHNNYYEKIEVDEEMSRDLISFKKEIELKILEEKINKLL
ncbi:MAG: hypothetical protein JST50_10630 [Bacteroidetes bacterium]|jgi:hypothetical protein|nr:hypothetical protein [Bacteroidota bacterium]